jgi:hypothetical protein
MKLQDIFPHNSTLNGLESIFHAVGNDSFYFDAEGIRSNEKIITTGKTLILLTVSPERSIMESTVRLVDVFYFKHRVYLMLIDLETEKILLINQYLDTDDTFCNWRLLDIDYLKQRVEES